MWTTAHSWPPWIDFASSTRPSEGQPAEVAGDQLPEGTAAGQPAALSRPACMPFAFHSSTSQSTT